VKLAEFLSYDPKATKPGLTPNPIPWPTAFTPTPVQTSAVDTDPLPQADVLVVTYTVAEGQALADVLTPGHKSSSWTSYRNNWPALKALVAFPGPSLHSDRAAIWAVTQIGNLKVVLVKSDLHPSTDGPKLPMVNLWQQMIAQVQPKLVITTGTAGGVGADTLLGDVIATSTVRWDANTKFKTATWAHTKYSSDPGRQLLADSRSQEFLREAQLTLIPANSAKLPKAPRLPVILTDVDTDVETVTTDFFAFDTSTDAYGLRKFDAGARAVEMDDGALGLALTSTSTPPAWLSVRNASDPQMTGGTLKTEDKEAAAIYRKYGYWTTVNSAIACWALIAAQQ
jgi:nucleoside phosphorylase